MKSFNPCKDGYEYWLKVNEPDLNKFIQQACKDNNFDWAIWLYVRMVDKKANLRLSIFSAESVLHLHKGSSKAPMLAIEAAKKVLRYDNVKNRKAAAYAAYASAYDYVDSADDVDAAASSAASAASSATTATDTAAATASASSSAASVATAASYAMKKSIINFILKGDNEMITSTLKTKTEPKKQTTGGVVSTSVSRKERYGIAAKLNAAADMKSNIEKETTKPKQVLRRLTFLPPASIERELKGVN